MNLSASLSLTKVQETLSTSSLSLTKPQESLCTHLITVKIAITKTQEGLHTFLSLPKTQGGLHTSLSLPKTTSGFVYRFDYGQNHKRVYVHLYH